MFRSRCHHISVVRSLYVQYHCHDILLVNRLCTDTGSIHASTILYKSEQLSFWLNVSIFKGMQSCLKPSYSLKFAFTTLSLEVACWIASERILKVNYTSTAPSILYLLISAGIDSSLSDNFGRSVFYFTSAITTFITITAVGGPVFFVAAIILAILYYNSKALNCPLFPKRWPYAFSRKGLRAV